ncbi:cytochrome P450 [Streptomyces griseomycini]|uniref:Cytochrome P450 n=1 Tax=Streptomyces griseomycini TaxID=66895 RepID=A0A7W7LYY9_9ACTN|nr:cytochrome P450 [Streptomyces griseomycini]MBB4899064.1 cytochrome P450 [Streptomyces griseomycini]GGR21537.1 cytochrome P450 [Streptomyces griseomycini]
MTAVGDIRGTLTDRRAVISLLRRLRSPEGQADPLPVWEEMRSLGDVVPAPWGGYFVTGFDACSQVLRGRNWLVPDFAWQERQPDPERWQAPATREMTRTLPRLNAPTHTCQRRALGNPFDRTTLQAMRPRIAALASGLLDDLGDRLRADGEADFVRTVAEQLPMRTVGEWLGIAPEHFPHILDFTHRQVYAQELLPTKSELAVSAQATLEMRAFFTELVRQRRAHPGNDVLTGWIHHWDARYPDDRAAADQVVYDLTMFITIASLETTAVLLTNAVWFLTQEPSRAAWLRRHPEHIDDAIEETLRYDPPVVVNSRIAADDTVLAGVPLAKDTTVHVLYGSAAHDPRRNERPHVFDILRNGSHLAFGGGAHYCLGAALARLEARELLGQVLERFPTLRPAAPPVYDTSRVVFRRVSSLKVTT